MPILNTLIVLFHITGLSSSLLYLWLQVVFSESHFHKDNVKQQKKYHANKVTNNAVQTKLCEISVLQLEPSKNTYSALHLLKFV